MGRRVMVIGLDGGTWQVFDRFIEAGRMPHLKRLCETGFKAVLESSIPPVTPVAWTSFATGMNPGKHGVFGFTAQRLMPGACTPPPVRRDAIRRPTLWRRLSDAGRRCIVLSVPLTYPPEPVNGAMVTGMFTPGLESDCTYPPALKDELLSHGCMPRFQMDVGLLEKPGWENPRVKDAIDLTESVLQTVRYLGRQKWDFLMAVFVGTDRIQHTHWPQIMAALEGDDSKLAGVIRDFYSKVDAAIGEMVAMAGEDTTCMLMSDHGFGPGHGRLSLSRWLIDDGYATYRAKPLRNLVWRISRRLGLHLGSRLERRVGAKAVARMQSSLSQLDWRRTRAFPARGTPGVRINLKGREQHGIVKPGAEYDSLREELRQRALELTIPPENKRAFCEAWYPEEIYHGEEVEWAPDLVLRANPEYKTDPTLGDPSDPRWIEPHHHSVGSHLPEGIFLASGPGVRPNAGGSPVRLIDLAPTILWLIGEPVPPEMDGRVLVEAIEGSSQVRVGGQTSPPPDGSSGQPDEVQYSEEDQRVVEQRLRNMGYLD